jgi:hypothetical protein
MTFNKGFQILFLKVYIYTMPLPVWLLPAIGSALVGKAIDSLDTGGAITKDGLINAHAGEFVLPANAKPTPQQRRIVAQNKMKKAQRKVKAPAKKAPARKAPAKRTKKGGGKLNYV